jgi:Flp pilus assembly protein TadG
MAALLRRAFKDRLASAAIDFAMIFPIMIVLFLGTYEVANAIIIYMRVIDSADTMSDLTTTYRTVASSDLTNIYTAGQMIMEPASGSGLGVSIASVAFNASTGSPSVVWQVFRGTNPPLMSDAATAASGLGSPGDSVIEAEATYTYTSIFRFVLPRGIQMSSRVFSRPRYVTSIPCTTSPCD